MNNNKKIPKIHVLDYVDNAANNLSYARLIIYSIVSLFLTVILALNIYKEGYEGNAFVFSSIALCLIAAYALMNIVAIFKKRSQR